MSHHDHFDRHHHHGRRHDRHHHHHDDRCCCGHGERDRHHDFHGERCRDEGRERDRGDDFNPFDFQRHFVSEREVIEVLQDYLTDLENEAQGVREAIAEMKSAMAEAELTADSIQTGPVDIKPEKKKKKKK
ncbi:MAG: DUF5320 domain-containing protein [Deltaproteobacteria bacterium]|nr:DUF5320 domain-containing protein [Deltaproteobacteria bacterium]